MWQSSGTNTCNNEPESKKTLDHTIRIGSTPTFLYFDLYHSNISAQAQIQKGADIHDSGAKSL